MLKAKNFVAILLVCLFVGTTGYAAEVDRENLSQIALLQSLAQGYFGGTLTKEEAEAYLAELENLELDSADLDKVAGGSRVCYAVDNCASKIRKNDCVHMF